MTLPLLSSREREGFTLLPNGWCLMSQQKSFPQELERQKPHTDILDLQAGCETQQLPVTGRQHNSVEQCIRNCSPLPSPGLTSTTWATALPQLSCWRFWRLHTDWKRAAGNARPTQGALRAESVPAELPQQSPTRAGSSWPCSPHGST